MSGHRLSDQSVELLVERRVRAPAQREGAGVLAHEQHIVTARRAPGKRLAQRHGPLDFATK